MEESLVPPHISPGLVRDYVFASQPGVDKDPFLANGKLFDLPEIYYAPKEGGPSRQGAWVVARARLIREVYQDVETFSNRDATGFLKLIGRDIPVLPVEADPPLHTAYRGMLAPRFSPARIAEMEAGVRRRARALIDGFAGRGCCEFEREFGRPFPASVFLDMMGLPESELGTFVQWEEDVLHGSDIATVKAAAQEIANYLEAAIEHRRNNPRDDLITHVAIGSLGDRRLTDDEALGTCFLLFLGGLDTVTATINFAFKHLAENPSNQVLLRSRPDLMTNAVEEFMRAFTVTPSPRIVAKDTIFHGVEMKKGDRVVLAVPMSGRDEAEFDEPNRVNFERQKIRHLTFATGPHQCLGAHLARREVRIALEEWFRGIGIFRIDPNDPPRTRADGIWSVTRLSLNWDL